jgi:hypothetical protein
MHIILLFAFLLIAGLRGTCYVTVVTADTEHACCVASAADQDMTDSACCDDFAPSRVDIPSAPVAVVIERLTDRDLVALHVNAIEWPETIRPPPGQTSATRPIAPRAPPLS